MPFKNFTQPAQDLRFRTLPCISLWIDFMAYAHWRERGFQPSYFLISVGASPACVTSQCKVVQLTRYRSCKIGRVMINVDHLRDRTVWRESGVGRWTWKIPESVVCSWLIDRLSKSPSILSPLFPIGNKYCLELLVWVIQGKVFYKCGERTVSISRCFQSRLVALQSRLLWFLRRIHVELRPYI